jgi:hypothetical protein|tara:strand:- start:4528 stop:4797 length:270 start_codon:yes stop_codon:yes gene_type:complete
MDIAKTQQYTSSTTLKDLATSMKDKKFHTIEDPLKRQQAIYDHLMNLMIDSIHDRTIATELATQRINTIRQYSGSSPVIESVPVDEVKE